MEWTDEGIVLGVRRHGETSVILEAMTHHHGRHLGVVRGGRSRTLQPVLQPGNAVQVTWRARLDDHLGHFAVEGLSLHASRFLSSRLALFAISHVAVLLRLLPERDPHPSLHDALLEVVSVLADPRLAPALVARFELAILEELGFGLDLSACAATGEREDLIYVSPKTGRAVSRKAGAKRSATAVLRTWAGACGSTSIAACPMRVSALLIRCSAFAGCCRASQ